MHTPYRKALSQTQMEENAREIWAFLSLAGWSDEAAAACLGNWQAECTLNPNWPQNADFPLKRTGGFGLPQWTPWGSKYGAWCEKNGIAIRAGDDNPAGQLAPQMEYHDYECLNGIAKGKTWYANKGYSYAWEAFKKSRDDVEELARAYYWQYERSASRDPGSRPAKARAWLEKIAAWRKEQPEPEAPQGETVTVELDRETALKLAAALKLALADG